MWAWMCREEDTASTSAVSRAPIHVPAQPSLDIAVAPLPAIDAADDSVARTSASGGRAGGADVQTRRSPRVATGASSASAASGVVATSPVRAPRTAIETPGSSAAARSPLAPALALLAIAVSVAGVHSLFDDQGRCTDADVETMLRGVAHALLTFLKDYICPRHILEDMVRSDTRPWATTIA